MPYFLFGDFNFRTDTASVIKVRLVSNYDNIGIKNKEEIKYAFAFHVNLIKIIHVLFLKIIYLVIHKRTLLSMYYGTR